MKIIKSKPKKVHEGDLTPMIDMTFQLIAFFMVLINFSQIERSEDILLPDSVLAKPPEAVPKHSVVINLRPNGAVSLSGTAIGNISLMKPYLDREVEDAARRNIPAGEVSVIIRSHKDTPMKIVQRLISKCQDSDLEAFTLRVNEQL